MARVAAAPLEQEQGGVVAGGPVALAQQRVRQPTDGLLDRAAGLLGLAEMLDQAEVAELLAAGQAFLDDAVGVEQDPVAALQALLADHREDPRIALREPPTPPLTVL